MKILIIGDQHVTGYGLSARQVGFVGHFVRQISRTGQAVTIEAYPQPDLSAVCALLTNQALDQYDLIIWQSGCLEQSVIEPPARSVATCWQWVTGRVRRLMGPVARTHPAFITLHTILRLLKPHRHKVLIMTPVPQVNKQTQWWQEQGRQRLLEAGCQQGFSVFDTSRYVHPTAEYFLTHDPTYLNAVGHELAGRALFDFYQATPTIVTIRSVRKN